MYTGEHYSLFVVRHVGTSTARHVRRDSLDTSNESSCVETWRDEPSGIWAWQWFFSVDVADNDKLSTQR